MKKSSFTLVELLVVIGIILVLAGLLIPAVSGVQKQGRITQAKSDMSTISMALAAFASDNGGKYLGASTGSGSRSSYQWGNVSVAPQNGTVKFNAANAPWVIWELSNPDDTNSVKNNKRKIRYLDPSPDYDGGKPGANNWLDPWGTAYVILFRAPGNDFMNVHASGTTHNLYADVALYSCGPDGTDNNGCNVETDNHGVNTADDVATWHK
ncbi:MAG: type II secretion system GspH family protein [Victivallaceae bacterium]|nr:type II secretion system GspH family protein [Victivallaceae bacterium]